MAKPPKSDPYAGMGDESWSRQEEVSAYRKHKGSIGGLAIFLDNNTVLDTAAIGTTIGNLSVAGGTGVYTFTLVSNPGGLFSIAASQLKVAAALTAGTDPISIKADNGAGSTITVPFNIIVHHVGAFVPTYELLGF